MARISDAIIKRIKRETDLGALVRSKGVALKPHGSKDLIGLCPFHEEQTPSLVVTPSNNLFHCMGCGAGGSVIDFLMRHDRLSFRHAVEVLDEGENAAAFIGNSNLECPVDLDASGDLLMEQVLKYYRERLRRTPAALDYLKQRGIADAIEPFGLGFADRTLGLRLPSKHRADGAAIRKELTKLGLYRESGHEHFNGCIVFPISDAEGQIVEIYGRKVGKQKNKIYHLYLPGPHQGLLNQPSLSGPDIILCESVIDALTFWVAGITWVTCIYGTEGFTEEHLQSFVENKMKRVFLAYDRDDAGQRAAERDADRLSAHGIDCYRVAFPHGMDANEYARKLKPATKALELLLDSAQRIGGGPAPMNGGLLRSLAAEGLQPATVATAVPVTANGEATKEKAAALPVPEPVESSPSAALTKVSQGNATYERGDRCYRVSGLEKNNSFEVLKITLRLSVTAGQHTGQMHIDNLDLYQDAQRRKFIDRASEETQLEKAVIKSDLGRLLLLLEAEQDKRLNAATEPAEEKPAMTPEEEAAAMEVLKDPKLIDRISQLFESCGLVGEETNRLVAYLACTSRKLTRPLAVIIQSTSAAGKTTLMDAVLAMFPEEERIKYSAMTGQSLFYLGETNLQHKILAIVEEEGAEKASYALKLLQSEGELTIASTGKDANTGRMKTEEYHVEGPAMIFLTTTAVTMDEELQNRCLVLSVDESQEQTRRIHQMQRQSRTLEGLVSRYQRQDALKLMCNVQRLIEPISVVNPFSTGLSFYDEQTRTRRDHEKYLALIDAITLLHQHQREVKTLPNGSTGSSNARYVETTLEDIQIANRLAPQVLGRCLDELPPQSRQLLNRIKRLVREEAEAKAKDVTDIRFTRRQAREAIGWSVTQVRVHLDRLQELEYVWPLRGRFGVSYEYRLLVDAAAGTESANRIGLIEPSSTPPDGVNGAPDKA